VNTFVNSGITAAATVPHEMITESVNHRLPNIASGSRNLEAANVTRMDRMEHTQHEARQRGLEVDLVLARVLRTRDRAVAEVRDDRGEDHQHAHHEDPHQERGLVLGITASAMNEISATPVTP
jgi:hypothetical protein